MTLTISCSTTKGLSKISQAQATEAGIRNAFGERKAPGELKSALYDDLS